MGLFQQVEGDEEGRAGCLDGISAVLRAMGRGEEARTAAQEAQALRSCPPPAGCPQAGSGPDGRRRRADSLRSTGITMRAAGRYEEARAAFRQALDLYRDVPGSERKRRIVRCGIADLLPAVKGEQVTVDNRLKQRT